MKWIFGALALAMVACGSDDSSGAAGATQCSADNRKDVYTAGLTKTAGNLAVKLVSATPAPPAKGTNTMTLEIRDAAGQPIDGATVTVTPFMPDHGHGSAVVPVVTGAGGGRYDVAKVYFAMAGLWKVTVSVQSGGGAIQEASFQFCLDG